MDTVVHSQRIKKTKSSLIACARPQNDPRSCVTIGRLRPDGRCYNFAGLLSTLSCEEFSLICAELKAR
jgi:hypothetical protein